MVGVNSQGYLERKIHRNRRNWWFVKYNSYIASETGLIFMGHVCLPKKYIGKKVRFKIEVIEEENNGKD